MMAYRRIVTLSVLVSATLFVLFHFDLIRKIPGFYCEGFGCIGLGMVMMVSPVVIAILFFVGGVIFAKQHCARTGFAAARISFVFAALAAAATAMLDKLEVSRAVEEACREDPATYCPETLYSCTVSGNVTTCSNPDAAPHRERSARH